MTEHETTLKSNQVANSYLFRLAEVVLVLAVCLVIFTVAVDPYRMYGAPVIPGWTELKPRIYQQSDLAKTRQLERIRPKTLLLGNSRVEIGFDPESKAWPAPYQPVFNAAEAGRGLSTALAMLREDIAVRPPRTVFLGLDFQDFLSASNFAGRSPLSPPGPDERRLLVTREGNRNLERPLQLWKDRFATTLTLAALTDSVLTVLGQQRTTAPTMTSLGFNPLHEYRLYAHQIGYGGLFLAKAKDYQQQYSSYRIPDFSNAGQLTNFRVLRAMAVLAHTRGINLIFFTQPYHADYLEMLHRLGLWQSFEEWKRSIAQFAAGEGILLYDFAEYDDLTTERVPEPGDTKAEMRWYWEPGHYKAALGDEMLKVMINGPTSSFGRRLTSANVGMAITETSFERAAGSSHKDDISGKARGEGKSTQAPD